MTSARDDAPRPVQRDTQQGRLTRRQLLGAGPAAFALAGVAAGLAGCDAARGTGEAGTKTKGPATISFSSQGNPQEFAMFDRILDAFEQSQPRIKVERR